MATLQNSNSSEKGHASHEEFHQEGEVHVGSHEEISWHLVGAIVWAMLLAYSSELRPNLFIFLAFLVNHVLELLIRWICVSPYFSLLCRARFARQLPKSNPLISCSLRSIQCGDDRVLPWAAEFLQYALPYIMHHHVLTLIPPPLSIL